MLRLTIRDAGGAVFQEHGLTQVQTWHDVSGAVCAYGYVGRNARWIRWPGLAAFRFEDDGTLEAFPERSVDASHIVDLCRRTVVPLVLQALGWETLHASAVRTPAGLVGFCGERHSGKSTLAYSLSRRGYRQHADDMLVLHVGPDGVRSLDLPFDVRLRPEASAFFGFAPGRGAFDDIVSVDPRNGTRVSTQPLSTVFVLRHLEHGEPAAQRLAPAAAFTAVLAHVYCFNPQDPEGRKRLLQHYLDIAAAIPVYELRFAAGLDRLDAVLERIDDAVNDAVGLNIPCVA